MLLKTYRSHNKLECLSNLHPSLIIAVNAVALLIAYSGWLQPCLQMWQKVTNTLAYYVHNDYHKMRLEKCLWKFYDISLGSRTMNSFNLIQALMSLAS